MVYHPKRLVFRVCAERRPILVDITFCGLKSDIFSLLAPQSKLSAPLPLVNCRYQIKDVICLLTLLFSHQKSSSTIFLSGLREKF